MMESSTNQRGSLSLISYGADLADHLTEESGTLDDNAQDHTTERTA